MIRNKKNNVNSIFVLLLAFFSSSLAVTIDISPDKNISVSRYEIAALKSYMKELFRFHMSDKGAMKVAKENKILANEYIKKYGLSDFDKSKIEVMANTYLADNMVKRIQNEIKISDKVLYSYYLDNKEKYKTGDKIDFISFEFNDMRKAIDFYVRVRDKDFSYAQKIADEENVDTKEFLNQKLFKIDPNIKKYLDDHKSGYFLPPIYLKGRNIKVLYVKNYKQSDKDDYLSFEQVKDEIAKKLKEKNFIKVRNELIEKYKRETP